MRYLMLIVAILAVACGGGGRGGTTGPSDVPTKPVSVVLSAGSATCENARTLYGITVCDLTVTQPFVVSGGSATMRDYAFVAPASASMAAGKAWTGDRKEVFAPGTGTLTLGPVSFADPSFIDVTINFETASGNLSLTARYSVTIR